MISPEQQQAAQEFLKTSGYKPPAGSPMASAGGGGWYDAVKTEVAGPAPESGGFVTRVDADLKKRKSNLDEVAFNQGAGKTNTPSAILQTGGELAGGIVDVGTEALKSVDKTVTGGKVGDFLSTLIKKGMDTPQAQGVEEAVRKWSEDHPEAAKNLGAAFNIASILPIGGGAGALGKGAAKAGEAAADVAKAGGKALADIAPPSVAIRNLKLQATKGNQIPTLESAAQKGIPLPGDTQIRDPLARYDEHVAMEKNALKDAKADTSLGAVGGRIGDAFEQVAKTRREAGEKMASELEKIGDKATDVTPHRQAFQSELTKNGLAFDSDTATLIRSKTSKLTESDRGLVEDYVKELEGLGATPTISHLDAFLSRIPDEMKVYKSKNNITGTTNGERIIKNNLTQLRSQFDASKTGKGYLKDYSAARKQYADLSKFLEEGQAYLGKKTQSGDYAKDASIAKSSVQSILNSGKKDWLLKLEHHTGYPAIDDATLALQAMKDTGDYRGASLLESITDGAMNGKAPEIPTTGTGMINYALGTLLKKGAGKFVGTPTEQTRRYLESLKRGPTNK